MNSIMVMKRFVTSFPWLLVLVPLAIIGTLVLPPAAPLMAQYRWSPQQRIPDYDDQARAPYLVADQKRTVHAFNYQPVDDDGTMAIFYRQWTVEQGWTTPVDILLAGNNAGPCALQGVFLDQAGIIHLIFFAGSLQNGVIHYSRALAMNAGRASAWSTPRAVGEGAGPQTFAALTGDDRGNLIIVYSGQREGIGLYEVHSADGGDTWSEPVIVSLVYEEEHWPIAIQLDMDRRGRLHAVWSLVNANGFGEEIYYARLEANRAQWSEPILLAARDEGDYSANWPSIIVYKDELFVIYMDGSPTRWMRRSSDGGQTWTAPVRPFPHEGEYEYAVLMMDSSEVLYMILGNRTTDNPAIHGMWHSVWLGERWSALEAIVSGPGTAHFDPSNPRAVISQGNVLLATWWTDTSRAYKNGVWYSSTVLDAPELPVVPLPSPTATPTTPPATATPTTLPPAPTSTPRAVLSGQSADLAAATGMNNPAAPVIVGVAPVVLLIAVAIVVQRLYYRVG